MRLTLIALPVLALILTACEGGGDPVEQAMRDASAERHAALVKDGETSGAGHASAGHATTATSGDRAFAASEAAMHERMMAASGGTVDEAYIAKMIEHHRGAVAMAEVALKESRDPEVRRMAQTVIDEMRAWKPAGTN